MAEKQFVQYEVNSIIDVQVIDAGLPAQIAKAGEIAVAAVQEQTEAALNGDLEAGAKSEAKLRQALDAVKSLASVKAQLLAYETKPLA